MRLLNTSLLSILFLLGCANEPQSEFQKLQAAFEADANQETYQALMAETVKMIQDTALAETEIKSAMTIGYEASKKIDNKPQVIGFLNTFIKEYPKDETVGDKLFELGAALNQIGKSEAGTTILQGFIESFSGHEKAEEAKKMLPDNLPLIEDRLQNFGESMFDMNEGSLKKDVARNFVDVCEAYALTHHGNPKSAEYLHKAAETARAMRTIPKALSLYDWILEQYPNHEKASQALFLKAFTYDNNLGDIENARKYYESFLAKYPEDDFADDTEFLLNNLGKSDEEILEALTKKTQGN